MKALVVYESFWGNTEAIANAVAEGIGPDARAVHTDEATPDDVARADLLVTGAPLMGFALPRESTHEQLPNDKKAPKPADVSHPTMRAWLSSLPSGQGKYATFETRFRWSPGSAAGGMSRELDRLGYSPAAKRQKFLVAGMYGPMRDGEIDRARRWGAELAKAIS